MDRGLLRIAVSFALCTLAACVEIDPAYADSFTSTSSIPTTSGSSTDASSTSDASASGSTTTPAACDCGPFELCEDSVCTQPAKILFVNLDGATTTFGNANAAQDVQGLYAELAGSWASYDADAATRETLLSTLEAQWAAYRVLVTDTRPGAGAAPYMMAVVTATPPPAGFEGIASVAYPDCGEAISQDVSFAFASAADGFGVLAHANWVSLGFARGMGLHYNDASDDLMGFGDRFVETCYAIADPPLCPTHHPEYCGGDTNQQSSHLELEAILGAHG